MITDEMRAIISDRGSEKTLKDAACKAGYRSLSYDGLKKALLGFTTIEELETHAAYDFISG